MSRRTKRSLFVVEKVDCVSVKCDADVANDHVYVQKQAFCPHSTAKLNLNV